MALPMTVINKSLVSLDRTATPYELVGEASTMGLAPGVWPEWIAVVDDGFHGFLFQRSEEIRHDGEFGGFNYRSSNGVHLIVFND